MFGWKMQFTDFFFVYSSHPHIRFFFSHLYMLAGFFWLIQVLASTFLCALATGLIIVFHFGIIKL